MICEILCAYALMTAAATSGLGADSPQLGGAALVRVERSFEFEADFGASSIPKQAGRGTVFSGGARIAKWFGFAAPVAGFEAYAFSGPFSKSGARPTAGVQLGRPGSRVRFLWLGPDGTHNRTRGFEASYRLARKRWLLEAGWRALRFDATPPGVPLGAREFSRTRSGHEFKVSFGLRLGGRDG